jgi:hypothetical protein
VRRLTIAIASIVLSSTVATSQENITSVGSILPGCRAFLDKQLLSTDENKIKAGWCFGVLDAMAFMGRVGKQPD